MGPSTHRTGLQPAGDNPASKLGAGQPCGLIGGGPESPAIEKHPSMEICHGAWNSAVRNQLSLVSGKWPKTLTSFGKGDGVVTLVRISLHVLLGIFRPFRKEAGMGLSAGAGRWRG